MDKWMNEGKDEKNELKCTKINDVFLKLIHCDYHLFHENFSLIYPPCLDTRPALGYQGKSNMSPGHTVAQKTVPMFACFSLNVVVSDNP